MNRPLASIAASSGLALGLVAAAVAPGFATPPPTLASYGSSASAAAVHLIYYNGNDPNFGDGMIGNRYPFAQVSQDAGPSAYANASPNDYGPLAGFVITNNCAPLPPLPNPPQAVCDLVNPTIARTETTFRDTLPTAHAQYPSASQGDGDASVGAPPNGYGHVHAEELRSDAIATYAGGGLAAFNGATSEAHTLVNADGVLTSSSHSFLASANFLGVLQVNKVEVTSQVTVVNGVATPKSSVSIGSVVLTPAAAPGQPTLPPQSLTVNDQGVTISGSSLGAIPGLSSPIGNVTLKRVEPRVEKQGQHGLSQQVVGLQVVFDCPPASCGQDQRAEYILGEAAAQGFGISAPVVSIVSGGPTVDTNPVDTTYAPPADYFTGSVQGATGGGGQSSAPAPATAVRKSGTGAAKGASRRINPRLVGVVTPIPILPVFLLWEALTLGAVATMVWARRRPLGVG